METTYRQIRFSRLTKQQQTAKLKKDAEYELAVANLYTTLPKEQAQAQKAILYQEYLDWARANNLYELVTPERQLQEAEDRLAFDLDGVNQMRQGLGMGILETKERLVR